MPARSRGLGSSRAAVQASLRGLRAGYSVFASPYCVGYCPPRTILAHVRGRPRSPEAFSLPDDSFLRQEVEGS